MAASRVFSASLLLKTPTLFCNSIQSGCFPYAYIQCRHKSVLEYFRKKKETDELDEVLKEDASQIFTLDDEASSKETRSEEELAKLRNKSRLLPHEYRLVHGEVPFEKPEKWYHHTVRYKRRLYGKYGEKSGVNPGIMWPTAVELKKRMEYESICNPFTFHEMVSKQRAIRAAEVAAFEAREKEIDDRMKLVGKFKAELKEKQLAKEREKEASKLRKEKLMEEVRRHFGYTVDTRDERFQELLAKKEKEEKKATKEARRLEKQRKHLEKLKEMAATGKTDNTPEKVP